MQPPVEPKVKVETEDPVGLNLLPSDLQQFLELDDDVSLRVDNNYKDTFIDLDNEDERMKKSFLSVAKHGIAPSKLNTAVAPKRTLCPFYLNGACKFEEKCRFTHGMKCDICEKNCLDPFDPHQQRMHKEECKVRMEKYESQGDIEENDEELECGICMEKVLQKADPRFGLLNCKHIFCLACIRSWRSADGMQNEVVVRSCPVCRITTHFVTPSTVWIKDGEEKRRVIDEYKDKLKKIPCKYYNRGESQCPFGSSCFYAHKRPDGSDDVISIRTCVNSDSQVKILGELCLSDFISRKINT